MAQPLPYERDYDFEGFQSTHPSTPLPGDKVNLELDQVAETTDQIRNRIARLQDDDLALKRKSVGYDQLKDELNGFGFNPPTEWATETLYAARDTVFHESAFYRCETAHTSGTFSTDLAAGKWELVADFTASTTAAQAAQAAAEAAQAAAESAETTATAAKASAITSAANAATSADSAALSESNAAGSATSAEGSASDAQAAAGAAAGSATAASTSASAAAGSASAASASADAAAASAAEAGATLAGATMNTDTDVSGNSWVLDEDDMASDSAAKVPTQQSVKAYADTKAALIGGNVFALPVGVIGQRIEIQKHSSPADYGTTRASFVLQHEEDYGGIDVPNGTKVENVLFVFTDRAQGQTTSSTNSSVITGQGIRVYVDKENDGSAQAFTVSGTLGPNGVDNSKVGANGYNEFGGFQALMTNIGSSNGYMSAVEVHLKDSPDAGVSSYPTRMTGGAFAIAKYNSSSLVSASLHVLNEGLNAGAQDLDYILHAETRGYAGWRVGIDLYGDGGGIDFANAIAMQMKRGNKLRWIDATGALGSDIYANAAGHIVLAPNAGAQVFVGNDGAVATPGIAFASDPNTGLYRQSADVLGLVAGGVEVVRCLNNNLQMAISGGALKTVTEGSADSGGAGFKMLRVPN